MTSRTHDQAESPLCVLRDLRDYAVAPEFLNLGAKLKGGLPYQPWAAALVKERTAQQGKDDPVGYCKPGGAVRLLTAMSRR